MRLLATLLAVSALGCAEEAAPPTFGEGLGTPDNPVPDDGFTYAVVSKVDFRMNGAMPVQLKDASAPLRAFATNPASALLGAADAGEVSSLKNALPQTLRDRLEGWINGEVDARKVSGRTLRQFATDMADSVDTTLSHFDLDSALTMTPTKTTHALGDINFRPLGLDVVVPIGGISKDVITQHPDLTVAEAGALSLGDQKFGLAFGDHAWTGIALAAETQYGSSIDATLSGGLTCSTLAQAVAAKCYSGSCVGHATQLQSICDRGAHALAGQVRDRVGGVKLMMFTLASGAAHLIDDNNDGIADRITEGTWNVELDLGGGVQTQAMMFSAMR